MTTAAPTTSVQDYLRRLRVELADLPPGEVEDILDDVGVQLAESGDELGRLGSPEAYAAELRAAAGYPAAPVVAVGGTGVPLRPRAGLWLLGLASAAALLVGLTGFHSRRGTALQLGLLVLVGTSAALGWVLVRGHGLRELPEAVGLRRRWAAAVLAVPAAALELLGPLRSTGWVVRAVLASALVVTALSTPASLTEVAVLALVLVLPSVWVGMRARRSRAWRWVSLPLDAFAVGLGLSLLLGAGSLAPEVTYIDSSSQGNSVQDFASLPAYNVYPFDAAGNPLTGVYLFDQDGKPIRLYANPCYDGSFETTSGQEKGSNAYPLPNVVNSPQTGRCVTVPGVPFTALVPRASPTPTAGTAPSTAPVTPSSAPSPSSGVGSAPTTPAATTPPAPTTG